jgi:hypothetical protein
MGDLLRDIGALRVPASVEASPIAFRDWEAAVGTRIAARARPLRLARGVLSVVAASATWAQELSLLSDAIIAELRARGVAVRSLRFRVGEVAPPDRPPQRGTPRTAPSRARLPRDLERDLADVGDPDLRAAIAIAASTNLGWQAARREDVAAQRAIEKKPAPPQPATSTRRDARGPRSAASGSAPPDRTSAPDRAARRGKT